MGKIKEGWQTLRHRWRNHMPKFFRRVCWIGTTLSATALAVNEGLQQAGLTPDPWWQDACRYLIGGGIGMATVAKLTQQYSGQPIDIDADKAPQKENPEREEKEIS